MNGTDAHVARIRALLDKAASTTFPEEADALLAKAQELMARHAIDRAVLQAGVRRDEVEARTLVIEAPYASAKVTLLAAVAAANRSRVVVATGPAGTQHATLVGVASDLDDVEALHASLSLQAVRFMLAADVPPADGVRRFRHAFLLSYGARIGERLRAAEAAATAEAEADTAAAAGRTGAHPAASVAMVLADRKAEVDQEVARRFGRLRTKSMTMSSSAGYRSGRRAADNASLGGRGLRAAPELRGG